VRRRAAWGALGERRSRMWNSRRFERETNTASKGALDLWIHWTTGQGVINADSIEKHAI